jgi:hypothetical protein
MFIVQNYDMNCEECPVYLRCEHRKAEGRSITGGAIVEISMEPLKQKLVLGLFVRLVFGVMKEV